MGVFAAVFGRRGAAGFSGPLLRASSGVVGFNLTMFVHPVREICRPARLHQRPGGEKGSTGRILSRARGEKGSAGRILYRQRPGAVLGGEYCLTSAPPAPPVVDLPPPTDTAARPITSLRRSPHRWQWGFGSIRRWLSACRRRVTPLMTPFPPFGGGQAPTGGSVAAKLQTTSAKNADNGLLWARWSAFWAQQCRTWCVVHM